MSDREPPGWGCAGEIRFVVGIFVTMTLLALAARGLELLLR